MGYETLLRLNTMATICAGSYHKALCGNYPEPTKIEGQDPVVVLPKRVRVCKFYILAPSSGYDIMIFGPHVFWYVEPDRPDTLS